MRFCGLRTISQWVPILCNEFENHTFEITATSSRVHYPGRFQFNFRKVTFKLTLVNGGWGISYKIAIRRMPQDLTNVKSTLVQVMAWCRQATSHYLSQCWPRSMSPNGITRLQWVKETSCLHSVVKCEFILLLTPNVSCHPDIHYWDYSHGLLWWKSSHYNSYEHWPYFELTKGTPWYITLMDL